MNCHQVVSGACNAGDHCFAVGSVEGVPFTAYAAGCNIVILASTFERVQIIPGAVHNYVRISCVDCSTDTGKIAAAYDNQICVFEPTPLIYSNSVHQLDYRWVQTAKWLTDSKITALSWNLEGNRLLTGGDVLQLWHQKPGQPIDTDIGVTNDGVTFEIGEEATPNITNTNTSSCGTGLDTVDEEKGWECVWKCQTATPVHFIAYSPDGTLFATASRDDRLVKIWFENKQLLFPSKSVDHATFSLTGLSLQSELNYGFIYISHPRAVTHLSWRKTSKYMPKGSVANMLVTSCKDNICRIWIETVLPDDGLVNMSQFDPVAAHNPKFRTHRHKHRFMQRLKHMKTCFHIRRHAKHNSSQSSAAVGSFFGAVNHINTTIPTLPSTYSVHDFHSFGFHGTGVVPGLHFHLAASINAETDIPLVPSLVTGDPEKEPNFVLHWLNNKDMHFTIQAESVLNEITKKAVEKEDMFGVMGSGYLIHDQQDLEYMENSMNSRKRYSKIGKSMSQDESGSDEQHTSHHSGSHHTLSNATSLNSLATDGVSSVPCNMSDTLDSKIECLLRDWHHSPDLLFAIHPVDGSYLIWIIEWLDEYHPGSFRQAQVSFSTRIPSAFPPGDATTMSTNVCLYHTGCQLQFTFRDVVKTAAAATKSPNGLGSISDSGGELSLPKVDEEDPLEMDQVSRTDRDDKEDAASHHSGRASSAGDTTLSDIISAPPSPTLSMVTKHINGTLNLWQLTFADKSKFAQVLSIGHIARVSGHRFRVNDITCHPVLPLLLTTSHHNLPDGSTNSPVSPVIPNGPAIPSGFCSELILWRVDPVGPLSKSGGITELARINSLQISAFSNVAWIPTLLPSTTLGNLSNSPSACFVASDGECLRVYQAVIDARTLLAEVSSSERKSRLMGSLVSLSTESSSVGGLTKGEMLHDRITIVSQQSTARPGCIIQLDSISDATHDWQNTQFLHVFQEQLITGEKTDGVLVENKSSNLGLMENHFSAMVDLYQNKEFEEPFYIVLLERTNQGTTIHMWRLIISSLPDRDGLTGSMMYVPDSQLVQDDDDVESGRSAGGVINPDIDLPSLSIPHIAISTKKVCTQELPIPDGVDVVHAAPAGGHLSSASIYPACFAPYILVTACSDSSVRFWKCKTVKSEFSDKKIKKKLIESFEWVEWDMLKKDHKSVIEIPGQPLNISAAYSGRIACAYKYGKSFTRPSKKDPESRYVNLCVVIYECESTGGSEWILEDTIYLKNINLPRFQIDLSLDLSYLNNHTVLSKKQRIQTNFIKALSSEDLDCRNQPKNGDSHYNGTSENNIVKTTGLLAVPSFSTLQTLRKSIIESGNTCPLTQKHLVQLDWVSKEDGSHILTVAVGSKIILLTSVSSDIAQANMKAMKESQSTNRPLLRKTSSLASPNFVDEIRWMKLRKIELSTADGLPPLPMQISWVRDGILVVAMDSEMHVYSQWKPGYLNNDKSSLGGYGLRHQESEDMQDTRNLRDEDLRNLAQETSQRRLANVSSMPHLSRVSSINLTMLAAETKKKKPGGLQQAEVGSNMDSYMPDYGLFEASRIACPVLPQYHPKQLMELLNSGKIRWVKAILCHLVRCISNTCRVRQGGGVCSFSEEESIVKQRGWSKSRTLSLSYTGASPLEQRGSTTAIPEEVTLDYTEITSIPLLPLWMLLAADREIPSLAATSNEEKDYNKLFDGNVAMMDENLDNLLEEDDEVDTPRRRERRLSTSSDKSTLSHFGPRQGRLLSRLLTHTHLPGLSSLDQMHLLALADTVSTCNTDFTDKFSADAQSAIVKESGLPEGEFSLDSLDDCGLRFLLAMKHYSYLLRCLPLAQRAQFQRQGIGSNNLVWAFHSESKEELLQFIPSYAKGTPKWSTLKELGVGWWIGNHTLLKTCIEKVAKTAYQENQEPLDAAIYYLAMQKKSVVWGLFRSKRDDRMTQFFANNFSEDRWRKAALKNAFALLGKQRFEHAAAFFLLAGALRDAIEVCLNKLEDLQLAMVLARLYEGERDPTPPSLRRLLYEEILGCDKDGEKQRMSLAHPDPFLRSMALWILKDFNASLNTLLQTNVGCMHTQYCDEDKHDSATNPNVFNFYVYLRTHPLLIRHYMASVQNKKKKMIVLPGFSYNTESKVKCNTDRQLFLEDTITPLERQLYFTTAHAHFKAGCPALALEVLSKLPSKVLDPSCEENSVASSPIKINVQDDSIGTGILRSSSCVDCTDKDNKNTANSAAELFDWSQPVSKLNDEPLELSWDNTGNETEESEKCDDAESYPEDSGNEERIESMKSVSKLLTSKADSEENVEIKKEETVIGFDIMAQQLKFVACLKILMEELSTLATGYEVDGGELRYHLYLWLEREVDALRYLCNYSAGDDCLEECGIESSYEREYCNTPTPKTLSEKPTLHEILIAEKLDFEAKVQRATRRKKWLKENETLLRTLLSYCSLHGASGGGLASVRMELVLLLQELQQEKTQQQLLSPLPFPTTLPLLSASVACNKTVVTDPVRFLQAHGHDILQTILEMRTPPMFNRVNLCELFVLRDLAVALSSCIYQSLCDSDPTGINKQISERYHFGGIENLSYSNLPRSHLIASQRRRRYSSDEPLQVTTPPSKWPGVTNLRALLAREKDEDTPRLNILLCECFVASYMSLVTYALATCDCHILYRLAGQQFTEKTWAILFGGGVKKLLKVAQQSSAMNMSASLDKEPGVLETGVWTTVTSLTKQRVRLNMKILGQFGSQTSTSVSNSQIKENKPTYREQFVPPEMSMVSYFLNKPTLTNETQELDYDSADSAVSDLSEGEEDEEDVFDSTLGGSESKEKRRGVKENTEHSNPYSYAWLIMRLAILKLVQDQLQDFLNVAGVELQELPVCSPLIHGVIRVINQWQKLLREELDSKGPPPPDYVPGCYVENVSMGPPIMKYRCLLEKSNTPFHLRHASAAPARRLWSFLVRQESVQDLFIRSIFGKQQRPYGGGSILTNDFYEEKSSPDSKTGISHHHLPEPVKIIHKEQDAISAFCLNQVNSGLIAIATPREIHEMDISLLLELPSWLEDECEFDLINLTREPELQPATGFLVIQTAMDRQIHTSPGTVIVTNTPSTPQTGIAGQTGRGASVVLKHRVDNIRRLCAHPLLPLYLTGSQDGSVQMWEWGHMQQVSEPRPPGTFAKVTRVQFSQHGNKFGVSDGDGNLSLWNVGLTSSYSRPFFTYPCHTKVTSDFVFLGSCSLFATAGHSSESKNVALWDSLLPQKKALVTAFPCHEQGASSIVYAPQHQLLISAGKKGYVFTFDLRQRTLRHRFQAHDSPIRCLALDPHEEFFITGAADGDVKVWNLTGYHLVYSFPGEHARSSFFKHIGQGVTQLYVDSGCRLFSCGADGSMKVRQLPDRDYVAHTYY